MVTEVSCESCKKEESELFDQSNRDCGQIICTHNMINARDEKAGK